MHPAPQATEDKAVFEAKSAAFKADLAGGKLGDLLAVLKYYVDNWEADAEHWAGWGRLAVKELGHNTNNLIERFFHTEKYTFGQRRILNR